MQFVEFREIIKKRASIEDEWYTEIEKCWEEMTELFSIDINKTLQFLDVCTADEFSWLSEIVENIAKKTRSKEFVAALRKTADKYPEETKQYNILDFIKSTECIVNGEQEEE